MSPGQTSPAHWDRRRRVDGCWIARRPHYYPCVGTGARSHLFALQRPGSSYSLFAALLIVPGILPKIILLGLVGICNSGWYSVLQAQLYTVMPGRSGAVLTVGNFFGLVGGVLPFAVGAAAEAFGLHVGMWILLLAPISLLVGIPRNAIDTPLSSEEYED